MANALDAEVSALSVLPPPYTLQQGLATIEFEFEKDLQQAVQQALELRCTKQGLDAKNAHVIRGNQDRDIGRWANSNAVDLICVGLHDRSGAEYFLGTVATAALRYADAAVFGCRGPIDEGEISKVVLALDSDFDAQEILQQTKAFLKHFPNAKIHVRHIVRPIASFASELLSDDEKALKSSIEPYNKGLQHSYEQELDKHLNAMELSVESIEVMVDTPSAEIKSAAAMLGADLIIMGTGKHIGVGWHIGSTTNNVMHDSYCNVLALRTTPHVR